MFEFGSCSYLGQCCDRVARKLRQAGVSALAYSAKLGVADRDDHQDRWVPARRARAVTYGLKGLSGHACMGGEGR
ncbi:unnamed protein product, partial [Closterium sp. NIES-64]